MRTALIQMSSSDDPLENCTSVLSHLREAASEGAGFALTPEVTNCVSGSRTHQNAVLALEADDKTLAAVRNEAAKLGIWVSLGSLALKTDDADGRFANRSFLIDSTGDIVARYDKIHMFDVQVSAEETYRESDGYRPGEQAVVAKTPFAKIGMTICYDVRFPYLYRALAHAGAEVLIVPAAFSAVTGAAHWESLLRARAIESGCYVLAAAQTGQHRTIRGPVRRTYGHSLAITPWGEVLSDSGQRVCIRYIDLDRSKVAQARKRVPSLGHDRDFDAPL